MGIGTIITHITKGLPVQNTPFLRDRHRICQFIGFPGY